MSVEAILTAIGNYGVTFVITAMVLYYLFKIANVFYTKFERKMINNHSKDLKERWPQTIEKNNTIHQLLYRALYKFKGDRAYIFEYHNGGHSISGIDFLKASNTFEVVNSRIQPHQISLQNLPVWVFAYWNVRVLNREVICKNVEDIEREDLGAYQIIKQEGIKAIYVIGLYDAKGCPIGFFGLDYMTSGLPDLTEKQKKDLEILSYQISGLLY